MYKIIKKRKIWLSISSILVSVSIIFLILWGLNLGIDFTGGSLLEVEFTSKRPTVAEIEKKLVDLELGSLLVQPIGEKEIILRFQDISEKKHQIILDELNKLAINLENNQNELAEIKENEKSDQTLENKNLILELRFDSVGPSIGNELKHKSIYAIIVVLIAIVLYIAWVFRKVSKPIASWKYGVTAIIALFHDIVIILGIFAFLGEFANIEINATFVAAILAVLGYSVNDTIVVFDRIRENLPKSDEDFENTVNLSVNQTITRSINTSITTLLVLLAILFFGGSSIRDFVLALSIGAFVGTYSSIFLASPLLVVWEKIKK